MALGSCGALARRAAGPPAVEARRLAPVARLRRAGAGGKEADGLGETVWRLPDPGVSRDSGRRPGGADPGGHGHGCSFGEGFSASGKRRARIDGSTSLVGPRGSVGYIAPEYGFGSKISTEGDVYSYGVIILEMLTGKRPTDEMFKDGLSLYNFVEKPFPEKIGEILDPRIIPYYADQDEEAGRVVDQENHHQMAGMSCIIKLVKIGLMCAAETPKYRPSMQDVYIEITAIKEAFSALQG
ncbi:hypothetical protein ZWY2020_002620 [Hordeum vulgare]|nr:hypothetical protein ZWY2020_002620 [Hordeum vulgare]